MRTKVGTAGWTIPKQDAAEFNSEGSSLERYSARLGVVEINSSFHRPHRRSTWERWRDSVPDDFRFSVKIPKSITHQAKLDDCAKLTVEFLDAAGALANKLGVLLVQLPPKLEFEPQRDSRFFRDIVKRSTAMVACEPRHPSWFTGDTDTFLTDHGVSRVAADPSLSDEAARPGGWRGLNYWRFHGSPIMYRSSYAERLDRMTELIAANLGDAQESWCIFDNTASSAAMGDALGLNDRLDRLSCK